MRVIAGYVSQTAYGQTGAVAPSFDFDGAVRVGPYVIESEGTFYTGNASAFADSYFQDYLFYRRGTRIIYDMPEDALRVRVGDIIPDYSGFQTSPDILGLSVQKAYATLQPTKNIRPTGAHSFRIERPSTVEIIVDNALVRRIKLGPGNYNLSDLPLRPGANNVKLVIEDDAGQRQTLEFTDFSGHELLTPDISEWSFNAGVKSYDTGLSSGGGGSGYYAVATSKSQRQSSIFAQREYYFDEPVVSALYRTGIFTSLTADANIQADRHAAMAGGGVTKQTTFGLVTAEFAVSDAFDYGPGAALQLGYAYDKFDWFGAYRSSLRVLGEYRTPEFTTVGTFGNTVDYMAYVSAGWSQQMPWAVTAGLSFSYYFRDGFTFDGSDRWQADVSFSRQIWDNVSGSLSLGYGRDQAAETSVCCIYNQSGFQAYLRVSLDAGRA